MKVTTDKAVKVYENMKDLGSRLKDEKFITYNGTRSIHHSLNTYGTPHTLKKISYT
jgi:hypothetical protein